MEKIEKFKVYVHFFFNFFNMYESSTHYYMVLQLFIQVAHTVQFDRKWAGPVKALHNNP